VAWDTKKIAAIGRHWLAEPEHARLGVRMTRLRKGRLRWAIAGGLVIALAVSAIVAWPYVQRYTGSRAQEQDVEDHLNVTW